MTSVTGCSGSTGWIIVYQRDFVIIDEKIDVVPVLSGYCSIPSSNCVVYVIISIKTNTTVHASVIIIVYIYSFLPLTSQH